MPEVSKSFIQQQQSGFCVRILKKIDIFSFIPVPKDDSVSTRQSLIGTAIFFSLFLAYVLADFINFVIDNPPLTQSYRTPLDDKYYQLPQFAIAFMTNNPQYDTTQFYDNLFTYTLSSKAKTQGQEQSVLIQALNVTYLDNKTVNFDKIPWLSIKKKQFYSILRTSSQPLYAKGLLFSSDLAVYPSLKINFCSGSNCLKGEQKSNLTNFGRFFLFIQTQKQDNPQSLQQIQNQGDRCLQYNFFVIEGFYKRISINFRIVRTEVLPDYFWRWSVQYYQKLQVDQINQQLSKVDSVIANPDAMAFNFQLSPYIFNNRISYATLLDHVSMWGAFWGVLFAVFGLFFLSYNRKKFYKHNPQWSKFKQVYNQNTITSI